ncbi:type IV secretory system conjugative DNA transfer family protein [Streptomyces sp. TLI_146]|uniref:type IV secretory system conjugative DNA transfer family protein n=1 Tax=Streptomyces sp. TLI_146 TaxID=1938858 RepID=UPI000C70D683|nr:type IV secretion system DNA-binding domain-containing protein [Streptomyces sp. TLI_146]PKV88177.1 type IV secretion system coupling TraD/TrwB family protein [Streptomyces sp. TLI_146]
MSDTTTLVASAALFSATIAIILILRFRDQLTRDAARVTYRLGFPRDLTIGQVTAFLHALTRLRPARGWLFGRDSVVFESVGWPGRIEHRLRLPKHQADVLLRQLRGIVPNLRTTPIENPALPTAGWLRRIRLTTTARPLRTDQPEGFAVALLSTLQPLARDELLLYQLVVYPVRTPQLPVARRPSSGLAVLPPWLHRVGQLLTAAPPAPLDKQAAADFKAKIAEPWFGVIGTVGATAADRPRAHFLVGRLMATLHQLDYNGAALVPRWLPRRAADWLAQAATGTGVAPVHVNAQEAATLLGWPLAGPTVPGLRLSGGRSFPPVPELPTRGRVLGTATYEGLQRPVAISPIDGLMHQLVTGPTGSGKSTLLLNQLTQDIQAGRGVILLDPGGDLARDVADRIPEARIGDLIYLDAADNRPVGINPLACAPEDAELVADQVMDLIKANADSWGPRLEEVLKAALVLLAATPGMTLVELPAVLTDEVFRASLLARLDPAFAPTVGAFFARFNSWSEGERGQAVSAVINKISPLTDRRQLRAMLGQAQPAWTMREVMEQHKILLVALPSGLAGSYAVDLLGGLLVSMVWNAAMRRAAVTRDQRQATFLYIDEAGRFLRSGADLTDMLARARGHFLGIIAALQHITQVPPNLRAALLSEARTKVVLQPGADDAATLARALGPLVKPEDLLTLEPRSAVAAVVTGGQVSPPVTIATNPPPEPSGWGPTARAASRLAYGRDRAAVEQEIADRRQASRPRSGARGARPAA